MTDTASQELHLRLGTETHALVMSLTSFSRDVIKSAALVVWMSEKKK